MFDVHTKDSAPEASVATMESVETMFGFLPNLIGVMAEAPTLAKGYATLSGIYRESSLSPQEQQLVLLITSFENGCAYCVAAHSGGSMQAGVDKAVLDAARAGTTLPDEKLEALRCFTIAMVKDRGWVDAEAIDAFLDAGYTKANILEIIVGIAVKTMSNYTNHIAETPLDERMQPMKWQKPAAE
jgi:uncharacterized peroxidase-related enzyme